MTDKPVGIRGEGLNFTERLRNVIGLAKEEAVRLRHEFVGTEHLLLGLLKEGDGVGVAALRKLNVNLEDVKSQIHDTIKVGKNQNVVGEIPFTSRAKESLTLAASEASGQNQTVVGTQDLLLGLLREAKGIAAQILMHAGASEETARAEIHGLLGKSPPEPRGAVTAAMNLEPVSWPVDLDALTASPQQHWLLLENDHVRVLDTLIEPGERTPVHSHRWPAAHYILSWSDFVRRDPDGKLLLDTRTIPELQSPPSALWGEPLAPHSLENVGTDPLHIISVEVKTPR